MLEFKTGKAAWLPCTEYTVLQVGDRVRPKNMQSTRGEATVRVIHNVENIGVECDNEMGGHLLYGQSKDGHGWWYCLTDLEVLRNSGLEVVAND